MEPKTILKKNSLRTTNCREVVLQEFLSAGCALSHADLEKTFEGKFDRVTIYRTLTSFLERGIIHKIPVDSGGVKYALCSEGCSDTAHLDNHVHFKCSICEETHCLEETRIPLIKLPTGYRVDDVNFLVLGICDRCNQSVSS